MKRRQLLQSIATLSAALPAAAQAPASSAVGKTPGPPEMQPRPPEDSPLLPSAHPESEADSAPRFFSLGQYEALTHLAEILVPPFNGKPGATDARAAEFLDFLVSRSSSSRQLLYRQGLDNLNKEAQRRFRNTFAKISKEQAADLLKPLSDSWTFRNSNEEPVSFLHAAKLDVSKATVNSREWSSALAPGQRGPGGVSTYWYSLD